MSGIPCPECRGYVGAHSSPRCPRAIAARDRAAEARDRLARGRALHGRTTMLLDDAPFRDAIRP